MRWQPVRVCPQIRLAAPWQPLPPHRMGVSRGDSLLAVEITGVRHGARAATRWRVLGDSTDSEGQLPAVTVTPAALTGTGPHDSWAAGLSVWTRSVEDVPIHAV